MLPSFCKTIITRYRAPLLDSRGSKVRDWNSATALVVDGCNIQPASESSDIADRENVDVGFTLYAPATADIEFMDRVSDGTYTYTVSQEPYLWRSPTGAVTHLVAHLEVWRG